MPDNDFNIRRQNRRAFYENKNQKSGSVIIDCSINALGFASQAAALSETVVVPFNVGQIGYNAFYKDGSSIKIICELDSFAEQFAQQNGLDYELTERGEEVVIEDESFEPGEPQMARASTRGGVPLTSLASVGVVSGVIIMAVIAIIIAKNNSVT